MAKALIAAGPRMNTHCPCPNTNALTMTHACRSLSRGRRWTSSPKLISPSRWPPGCLKRPRADVETWYPCPNTHADHDARVPVCGQVVDIIAKALIAAEPRMNTDFKIKVPHRNNCFEVWGFDIMLDDKFR